MQTEEPLVFVVDDDPSVRRSLERLLRSVELPSTVFSSARDFLDAIRKAVETDRSNRQGKARLGEVQRRVSTLTPREYEVFVRVVSGALNKQIAYDLGVSEKTVKAHRGKVMGKMQAKSLAHLVRMGHAVGVRPAEG